MFLTISITGNQLDNMKPLLMEFSETKVKITTLAAGRINPLPQILAFGPRSWPPAFPQFHGNVFLIIIFGKVNTGYRFQTASTASNVA